MIMNIQDLVVSDDSDIVELEINPILVLPKGKGVKAADALIRRKH